MELPYIQQLIAPATRGLWQSLPSARATITIITSFSTTTATAVKPWQIDPTKWMIWTLSKLGLVRKLRRVPTEKIFLAELAEAQRQLETELASSGLADATSAFMRSAYHVCRQPRNSGHSARQNTWR